MRGDGGRIWPGLVLVLLLVGASFAIWASRPSGSGPVRTSPTSEPTSRASSPSEVIHVDAGHDSASDRNQGTGERPLRTIGEAAARALQRYENGLATEVVIAPGTYRESIELTGSSRSTRGAIAFRGSPGTVVSGSDVWSGWRPVSGSELYSHPWPFDWGLSPLPEGWESSYAGDALAANAVIRRQEMIFVDGRPLRQEISLEDVRSTPGSFYIAEDRNLAYVSLPEGEDVQDAVVEVAVRPTLFKATNVANVRMVNITFQHAASPIETRAASFANTAGIRVTRSRFIWNNWMGLGVSRSKDVSITSSLANHNGAGGMSAYWVDGLLLQDTETSYNNWRGSRGATLDPNQVLDGNFVDFATGQKFFRLRDAVFRRHRSVGNLTGGLWLDWDHERVLLEGLEMRENLTHGLFVEASQGPITLRDSAFCHNETGFLIGNSENGTIENSLFRDNAIGQIFIAGNPSGDRPVQDRETGEWVDLGTRDWTMLNNAVRTGGQQLAVGTHLDPPNWADFVETLKSEDNLWTYDGSPAIFQIPGGDQLTLEGWRSHTGEDQTSLSAEDSGSLGGVAQKCAPES